MATQAISPQMDQGTAQEYSTALEEERSKLSLLVNIWLRELITKSPVLNALMDDLSDKAQARRLTPETRERLQCVSVLSPDW